MTALKSAAIQGQMLKFFRSSYLAAALAGGLAMGGVSCQTAMPAGEVCPLTSVTPAECLATAERYLNHAWLPAERNRLHCLDPDGQRVDTPDHLFSPPGQTPGYWKPGEVNHGIPYCWGGYDTPESFDRKIRAGKYAGDVYTAAKRAGLENAVSRHTAGVDCSGFVSRCWGLDWACSTRLIPEICDELPGYEALEPGDALNVYNHHVVLFAGFTSREKTELRVYETGSPLGWRVTRHTVPAWFLKQQGFKPYRYRGMKPRVGSSPAGGLSPRVKGVTSPP